MNSIPKRNFEYHTDPFLSQQCLLYLAHRVGVLQHLVFFVLQLKKKQVKS